MEWAGVGAKHASRYGRRASGGSGRVTMYGVQP